jgi:hypothetical protein
MQINDNSSLIVSRKILRPTKRPTARLLLKTEALALTTSSKDLNFSRGGALTLGSAAGYPEKNARSDD